VIIRTAIAAIVLLCLTPAASAEDPRAARIQALLPAEIAGAKPGMDDVIDESGTPTALTVVRFYYGPAGTIQVQVRLWAVENTAAEAKDMLDEAAMKQFGGEPVEIAGHKGNFAFGVLNLYPGYPDAGLTVSVGPTQDRAVVETYAGSLDYEALLAIK
jgi:hypothetical protein